MTEELKKIADVEISKLSTERRSAVQAVDWAGISEQIGKKYFLDEDEISVLQGEVLLVLLDLESPDLLPIIMEDELGNSNATAKKISSEIMEKIVYPIKEIYEDKIKASEKIKSAGLEQNVDFILSGGDYSAFTQGEEANNK